MPPSFTPTNVIPAKAQSAADAGTHMSTSQIPEKWVPAFSLRSSRNDVALAPHPEEQQSRVSKDGLVHNGVTLDSSFRWKCGLRELNVNFNTHVSCESTSPAP